MENKVMGIIKNVGFGMRDTNSIKLWFSIYTKEETGSFQVMNIDKAIEFIEAYNVYNVKDLEGKPVWMEIDNHSDMAKIHSPCLI